MINTPVAISVSCISQLYSLLLKKCKHYVEKYMHLEDMKSQIANNLWSILEALRIYSEYLESRDDIKGIAIDEKCLSEKNEEIGKRLMEIISPKIYQAMCIIEEMENG